jgi:methyl-accepting chemotaxis protein
MSVATLPAPLERHDAVAAPSSSHPRRTGRSIVASLALGFGLVLLVMVAVTLVAAFTTQGAAQIVVLSLGGAGLVAGGCIAYWLVRRVTRPLQQAVAAARRLSSGDLTGSFHVRAVGEVGALMQSLQDLHARLFAIVSEVRGGTTTVASTASQMRRDNEALHERTEAQVTSLQETAASIEELTAAVRQNADNAQRANTFALAASGRAEQGGAVMNEVVQTMGSIRDSSRSIVDIIAVIDGIAFQTNILALNAAVEAARAGEQGRGFAVVAAEVRTLAQRCAAAAKEIKGLIGNAVDQVDAGGRLVDDAGRAMGEIVSSVQQVADLMGQINLASGEQSAGIDSVNSAVAHIDRATQRNAALVEGVGTTVSTLHEEAVALLKSVSGFDLGGREHGNADEAHAMVKGGCEFHRAHGRDALIAEINKLGKGRFIDRDLYLMVVDLEKATFLAHGNNPRVLGQGPKSQDQDGKFFVQDMARLARERGSGWIEYKWAHPVTNEVLTKATYVERAGDVLVGCGVYKA